MAKAIETHYLGPTNFKGARIVASDGDGNRTTIAYDSRFAGEAAHRLAARALMDKMNWKGQIIAGATKRGYVFVFVTVAAQEG